MFLNPKKKPEICVFCNLYQTSDCIGCQIQQSDDEEWGYRSDDQDDELPRIEPLKSVALISITNRCTRRCKHCFEAASPCGTNHMTLETARALRKILDANEITQVTIYGGEIVCHPQWEEIIDILTRKSCAESFFFHSNGDWVNNLQLAERFWVKIQQTGRACVAVSNDGFHDRTTMERACNWLKQRIGQAYLTVFDEEDTLPQRARLLNVRGESGRWRFYDREQYMSSLLPLGRARQYACAKADLQRGNLCDFPKDDQKRIKMAAFLVTPDGNAWRHTCGVNLLGNVSTIDPDQFAQRYRESWQQALCAPAPKSCSDCFKQHVSDTAWDTRYSDGLCSQREVDKPNRKGESHAAVEKDARNNRAAIRAACCAA